MLESITLMPVDVERFTRASRAARFCGQTTARLVNCYTAGCNDKAESWQLELNVWQKRQQEAAEHLPFQKLIADELEAITQQAYQLHLVTRPPDLLEEEPF